jgi:hypothetical protein
MHPSVSPVFLLRLLSVRLPVIPFFPWATNVGVGNNKDGDSYENRGTKGERQKSRSESKDIEKSDGDCKDKHAKAKIDQKDDRFEPTHRKSP